MSYDLFISYRREDSQEAATSIHKMLTDKLGENVFIDTAAIEPGDSWTDRIQTSLVNSKIVLAIIGKNWLCKESSSVDLPRIFEEKDWVRKEIEMAMDLKKIVIPVLIGIDKFPECPDLPEMVKKLTALQLIKIKIQAGENEGINLLNKHINGALKSLKKKDDLRIELEKVLGDRYGELFKIGDGNKANVYLGKDPVLDRSVAIKVIVNNDFEEEFVDTLIDAAKIYKIIPNSIAVLEAYKKKPFHVIMGYLEKGTLRKMLIEEEGKQLPLKDVKKILVSLGEALTKIHKKGLAYCNVKPSNILLNDDLEPYLNPFSRKRRLIVSEIIDNLNEISTHTDPITIHEELYYLPPELFSKKANYCSLMKRKERVDQYMLGLVAYELLTGSMPQTITNLNDLQKKRYDAFKPLSSLNEVRYDCPTGLSETIHKMIHNNPDNRYNDLEDAIKEIASFSFDEFEIAIESYARCLSTDSLKRNFFHTFYNELIKISSKAARKFKLHGIGADPKHKQYHILREAIFMLLLFGKDKLKRTEPNILTRIAQKHSGSGYNVTRKEYDAFLIALTNTICGSGDIPEPFDDHCKNDDEREIIKNAWSKALAPGIEYMIQES
jgi:serine/threonine protein kinase